MVDDHLHRSGQPFTSPELQVMVHSGVMWRVIGDVYAESIVPPAPHVRAAGAKKLLNQSLHSHSVLCGETAAWIHLGVSPPDRIAVMVDSDADCHYAGANVQLHRSSLQVGEISGCGPLRCTTALRTAGDMFCGTGVRHLRRALDRLADGKSRADRTLQQWPEAHAPLLGRDEDVFALGAEDERQVHQRWDTITELMRKSGTDSQDMADMVMRIVSRSGWDHRRRERIRQLVDQCTSRRLPTVR